MKKEHFLELIDLVIEIGGLQHGKLPRRRVEKLKKLKEKVCGSSSTSKPTDSSTS